MAVDFVAAIAAVECFDYQQELVKRQVTEAVDRLGGIKRFVKPGQKVLVKPNLLMKRRPEEATTTHPSVVQAIVELARDAGGLVTVADSPGGLYEPWFLKPVYHATGMEEVCRQTGAALNLDTGFQDVPFPEGKRVKNFPIIAPAVSADVIITAAKLKTHGMTGFSGAVKNLFGLVPGTYKADFHFRLSENEDFCSMLIDLCQCKTPALCLVDGVEAMEGDGPSGGTPRHVGCILAGDDPYYTDLAGLSIIGLPKEHVQMTMEAIRRGLCPETLEEKDRVQLAPFLQTDFKQAKTSTVDFFTRVPQWLRPLAKKLTVSEPVFVHGKCVGCGECAARCPAQIIRMERKRPFADLKQCIHCFCCQELCPAKAIDIKRKKWFLK